MHKTSKEKCIYTKWQGQSIGSVQVESEQSHTHREREAPSGGRVHYLQRGSKWWQSPYPQRERGSKWWICLGLTYTLHQLNGNSCTCGLQWQLSHCTLNCVGLGHTGMVWPKSEWDFICLGSNVITYMYMYVYTVNESVTCGANNCLFPVLCG